MKQNKTYLHLGVTLIVSACAVLMFYDTFFQSRVLLDFFDKLMQVLSPVIYGLVFAYLLAPIVDFFDRYIQKGLPKVKSSLVRGLSILVTWICVIALIYLMFSILIPELVESVKTLAANFESYYKTVYNWVTALVENENLFSDAQPDGPDKDFLDCLNPESLTVLTGCKVEPEMRKVAEAFDKQADRTGVNAPTFQFMRVGYFCLDNKDTKAGHPVFNRSVSLKDSFKK